MITANIKLPDGSLVELCDFKEESFYNTVSVQPPSYPPRYRGEYLRSREQRAPRRRPKKAPHRVIPVKRGVRT